MAHHDLRIEDHIHASDSAQPVLLHLGAARVRASGSITVHVGQAVEGNEASAINPVLTRRVDVDVNHEAWLLGVASFTGAFGGLLADKPGALAAGAIGLAWAERHWRRRRDGR